MVPYWAAGHIFFLNNSKSIGPISIPFEVLDSGDQAPSRKHKIHNSKYFFQKVLLRFQFRLNSCIQEIDLQGLHIIRHVGTCFFENYILFLRFNYQHFKNLSKIQPTMTLRNIYIFTNGDINFTEHCSVKIKNFENSLRWIFIWF